MSKKNITGLIAILALTGCGGAEEAGGEAAPDNMSNQASLNADVSTTMPEAAKSAETNAAATDQKKDVEKADKSPAPSKAAPSVKTADCKITSIPGDTQFKGDCEFMPHGGGSFTVKRSNGQSFVDGITAFVAELDSKTAAGLSARDANGDLTYLGVAEKSPVDGACWESENHSVCVYAK
ncbi:hypothetical protein C8024_18635 [Sphingopyxis sp. BSNA05]|nr:hypothetical protein [Sphingopyxis sp. BSNA05]